MYSIASGNNSNTYDLLIPVILAETPSLGVINHEKSSYNPDSIYNRKVIVANFTNSVD
jgi:hypothetical protein